MGDVLFDRTVRVDVITSTGTVVGIRNLHISFDVGLRSRGEPNDAVIRIYNLSPTTRNLLREDGAAVRLFAGYAGKADKIFEGTIVTPVSNPDGPVDMVTEIISADGYRELDRSYFSRSYAAGTPIATILRDLVGTLGIPAVFDGLTGEKLLRGRTIEGKIPRVLSRLGGEYDFRWKVDFGTVYLGPRGVPDRNHPTAVLLNSETGLIGTPTVKFERFRGETRRRVVARSLMNANLRPGRLVKIESTRFVVEADKRFRKSADEVTPNGVFLIDEARFQGDNFGGDFDVEVTGYGNG